MLLDAVTHERGKKKRQNGYIYLHPVHKKGTVTRNKYYFCFDWTLSYSITNQSVPFDQTVSLYQRWVSVCMYICLGFFFPSAYYDVIQAWRRHSAAVALFSGIRSSMGRRKLLKHCASSLDHSYFSTRTSRSPHGFSLVMCLRSPGWHTIINKFRYS